MNTNNIHDSFLFSLSFHHNTVWQKNRISDEIFYWGCKIKPDQLNETYIPNSVFSLSLFVWMRWSWNLCQANVQMLYHGQCNLLKGIAILLIAAQSVVKKTVSSLETTSFSNDISLFQLEIKITFYKQCWPCMISI